MLESNYTLVLIRPQDWEPIRQWRNSQMDILRQDSEIGQTAQDEYAIWYYNQNDVKLYSFLLDGKLIGYGGLAIDWKNNCAETSFLLAPEHVPYPMTISDPLGYRPNEKEFLAFLGLLESHTEKLGLHRWYSETFAFRTYHIQCLEEYGFQREGVLRDHVRKNGEYIDVVVHGKILE